MTRSDDNESKRLHECDLGVCDWKLWGTYLPERQWGTVREDYSADGSVWQAFTHHDAHARAYRWGEDGILGWTDRECRLCFSMAFWNGRDPIFKERLFGLTGPEGNHGEDVKENYYYLDGTPTHSYMKGVYQYPHAEFPYEKLVSENHSRGRGAREYELQDAGVFEGNRFFDIAIEYAKASPTDTLIRVTVDNRAAECAHLVALPTLWFRNTWVWGRSGDNYPPKPLLARVDRNAVLARHETLGEYLFQVIGPEADHAHFAFTENETNGKKLYGLPEGAPFTKDSIQDYVIQGMEERIHPQEIGTKMSEIRSICLAPKSRVVLRYRLVEKGDTSPAPLMPEEFDSIVNLRLREADRYYENRIPKSLSPEEKRVRRQADAGLLWSKQFYHYNVREWIEGDPTQPTPPESRKSGRNRDWLHFDAKDILAMPDKWEYPWFAAWDLAFHAIPFAKIDPTYAKDQLKLLLREWFMSPRGELPAYEFNFSDANPPVHAWACWQVYQLGKESGEADRVFLSHVFQNLLINYTWWVNRKEIGNSRVFSGGFLGLDNVSVFDRSQPLPEGGALEQADATAWMALYSLSMFAMALELARENAAYEDMACKFFDHFVMIADAIHNKDGTGLWEEVDGFYYDRLSLADRAEAIKVRSIVGLLPLMAVEVFEDGDIERLPGLVEKLGVLMSKREEESQRSAYLHLIEGNGKGRRLLALCSKERLERLLKPMLDPNEFLSPFGIRSVSKHHQDHPYTFAHGENTYTLRYNPGESDSGMFGGNSNWRGPIWFPINYLLITALERFQQFFGNAVRVECPTGSGQTMNLGEVASEINQRLVRLFLSHPDAQWRDHILFHEFFHGDTGEGLGASHQTGWTALVGMCLDSVGRIRDQGQLTVVEEKSTENDEVAIPALAS